MMPDVEELTKFHRCLMKSAPKGYKPHYFKLVRHGKTPLLNRSWKKDAPLNFNYAAKWMMKGNNVGIGAMEWDRLVLPDLDGKDASKTMFKIPTLTVQTRSGGYHGYYYAKDKAEIPNIATDDQGEVRAQNQYVVAPGSYVPPEEKGTGFYTVVDALPPAWITFNDLPQIFKDQYAKAMESAKKNKEKRKDQPKKISTGKHSALFDITAYDVVLREGGDVNSSKRWGSLFHDSKTEANMSLSQDGKFAHCWRHSRAHNGLSCLAVKSGVITCESAGMPHHNSVGGNGVGDAEIFAAWMYAKKENYIADDDPIPVRALNHIAEKHLGYKVKPHERLPWTIYLNTLKILEELY